MSLCSKKLVTHAFKIVEVDLLLIEVDSLKITHLRNEICFDLNWTLPVLALKHELCMVPEIWLLSAVDNLHLLCTMYIVDNDPDRVTG